MKKKIMFFWALALILSISSLKAVEFSKVVSLDTYAKAEQHEEKITFSLKSTKLGFITTDVKGVVRQFSVKGLWNIKKDEIFQVKTSFQVKDMDTDNEGRNDKMWNKCLSWETFPQIDLMIAGPILLSQEEELTTSGVIFLLGKEYPFKTTVQVTKVDGSQPTQWLIEGKSQLSLKDLHIPDPSIFIARVHDDVLVEWKIMLKKSE
jgi:hypothetical protein